jgi:hypothetical protein
MKNHLKGLYYQTMEVIQKAITAILNSLQENDFHKFVDCWKQHWNPCTAAGGNCSEGDHCSSEQNLIECCLRVQ